MDIILDTSTLISERTFNSRQMESLLHFALGSESRIVLLDTVLAELEANQHRHVREQIAAVESAIRKSHSHKLDILPNVDRDALITDTLQALEEDLKNYTLWSCVHLRETSLAAYKSAVKRSTLRNKPSKANGTGVRDAIIWESILEIVKGASGPVVFVSANTSDFADSSGAELHGFLASEVAETGNHLAYYPSIEKLLEEVLEPASSISPEWVNENLDYSDLQVHITQWINGQAARAPWNDIFKIYDEKLLRLYEIDGLDSLESVSCSFTMGDAYAWNVPGADILVLFDVNAYVEADFLLRRRSLVTWREAVEVMEERRTWSNNFDHEADIDDLAPHSTVNEGWAELNFKFSAIVREGRIEDIELDDVDTF